MNDLELKYFHQKARKKAENDKKSLERYWFYERRYIEHLKTKYPNTEIGWSGHEYGLVTSFAAVAMGATWVERHVTLDRNMWGSDQKSSIEPSGLIKLVKGIRDIEKATQYEPGPRKQFPGESAKRDSLRKSWYE